jgi:hypothetical protein
MVLDAHPNIAAGPESKFLNNLTAIIGKNWYHMQSFGFPKSYWREKIRDFYGSFQEDYRQKQGKERWAEKSPTYTMDLPLIDDLFPESQVIHLIRDGRDVLASVQNRWGYRKAVQFAAAGTWKKHVEKARTFGQFAGEERYTEVRYEQLVQDPEQTLRKVFDFLDEPWDPVVLRYDEVEHDARVPLSTYPSTKPGSTVEQSAFRSDRVGAGKQELDPFLKMLFRLRGKGTMKRLGYM